MSDCIFCRIAAGELPADIVHEDEQVVVFKDIHPKAPVETAPAAGVAGDAAGLFHLEEEGVAVAVQADLPHPLDVAGGLALGPQAPARAGPVHGDAAAQGLGQGLSVHPGEHEHLAAVGVLGDGGDQALFVPGHLVQPVGRLGRCHGTGKDSTGA